MTSERVTYLAAAFALQSTLLNIPEQPPPAPVAKLLQNYQPVTDEQLRNPADGEWPMVRRTYDGWGYSPLDQITARNVKGLQPLWVMSTGMNNGQEAAPIVSGGVMFVSTSYNQVMAIDAKAGTLLWRYRSPTPGNARGKPVSRGVALYGDKVFFALGEAMLVSLDAKTGKEIWRTQIGDNASGVYMTAAPLIADGKVLIGVSGGDGPNRGFVAAYNPDSGKEIWKTYTIPAPGERGSDTWRGDDWKTGGGATWVTGNYDAQTNLVYLGRRQRISLGRVCATWRQSLRCVDGGHRCLDRDDQGTFPVHAKRVVGLGRGVAADPRRLSAWRPNDQRSDQFRAQRVRVFSRAQRRQDRFRRGHAVRETKRVQEVSIRRPAGPISIRRANLMSERSPTSVRPGTAQKTGSPVPTTRKHGWSTFPRRKISAPSWSAAPSRRRRASHVSRRRIGCTSHRAPIT